jgi:hypothetical protein
MIKRLIINEEEKNRILNLHETRKNKEWNLLSEQNQTPATSNEVGIYNNDKDYEYKKEGDKYFFKLKANPVSPKAQGFKKQGKFANWTQATNKTAIDAISKLPFETVFKGPGSVDGSDEAFEPPVQTVGTTTPETSTTPTASTTPETSTTTKTPAPTSQNPDVLADLKTASEIRQEFRQGKRDKNKATRQYNQMVNKYNKLKSKMSPQDNAAYLQAMNQLKQQMG